ncbi:MAG TPA: hypothetical protein HA232_03990 [Methanocellales archaeon]|nr:hypothetical protein [Methanocellales archaeon]
MKHSGISRLETAIEKFRSRGGRVVAIVGVSQKNTSQQGLSALRKLTDALYVYHSEDLYQTFHPKIYAIEETGVSAHVFIGSSNLTAGGLYTNYEADFEHVFDLTNPSEVEAYRSVEEMISSYSDTSSDCCLSVTQEVFDQLVMGRYLGNEEVKSERGVLDRGEDGKHKPLFGRERFVPPPVEIISQPHKGDHIAPAITLGQGFWKRLSNNDVSLTSSPGQIIIPIRFLPLFPDFSERTTNPNGAQQAHIFFTIAYTNVEGNRYQINNVRAIHYIPAPDHPRPNQEIRFTFRNQTILESLNKDDILVFRRTDNPEIWFDVVHVLCGTDVLDDISFGSQRFAAII